MPPPTAASAVLRFSNAWVACARKSPGAPTMRPALSRPSWPLRKTMRPASAVSTTCVRPGILNSPGGLTKFTPWPPLLVVEGSAAARFARQPRDFLAHDALDERRQVGVEPRFEQRLQQLARRLFERTV